MISVTLNKSVWEAFYGRVTMMPAYVDNMVGVTSTKWGESVTAAMKANHDGDAHAMQRYENQTLQLSNSIDYTLGEPQTAGNVRVYPIIVRATAPYAWDVETGVPGHSQPYPFFWKEIMNGQWTDMVVVDLTQRLNDLLASTAERS